MPEEYFLQIVGPRVSPAAASWESGLPLEGATTAPFVVDRGWVGPAGTYIEEWSIRREGKILYRHPPAYIQVRGHQSVRRFSDTVRTPLVLEPGTYEICFVVERYLMGSITVEAAPLETLSIKPAPLPPPPPPAAAPVPRAPAAKAASASPAPRPPAAAAPAYTGEDPSTVRERVFQEELAKGSDPRVAQARAKSAEMRAKKAAAAATSAPAQPEAPASPAPPPAEASANGAATEAVAQSPKPAPSPLVAGAPPGGGGFSAEQAAVVRTLVYNEAITKGQPAEVAEAQAKAAEIRARRGVWWRPDW